LRASVNSDHLWGLEKSLFPYVGDYLADRCIMNTKKIRNLFQGISISDVSFCIPLVEQNKSMAKAWGRTKLTALYS